MSRLPPISTRTHTLCPYTTLCLSVVSADDEQRRRIRQALWSVAPETFLANGEAGEGDEERQPILLSDRPEPANGAKFLAIADRSEEHTSELQTLMRISYAVFCLKKNIIT